MVAGLLETDALAGGAEDGAGLPIAIFVLWLIYEPSGELSVLSISTGGAGATSLCMRSAKDLGRDTTGEVTAASLCVVVLGERA